MDNIEIKEINRVENPINGSIRITLKITAKPGAKLEVKTGEGYTISDSITLCLIERR